MLDRVMPGRDFGADDRSPRMTVHRALVWGANNTSSIIVARALRSRGWVVDALVDSRSPWCTADVFDGAVLRVDVAANFPIESILADHPLDALFLHSDEQVRFMLDRWQRLPKSVLRHLPPPASLAVALSKSRSLALAATLGLPVLDTVLCTTPDEARHAVNELAGRHNEAIVKGDGGSCGLLVKVLRRGQTLEDETWDRFTAGSPVLLVQRRLTGRRTVATVVFEHGVERALCVHEKRRAGPGEFGPSAIGVTAHIPDVEWQAATMFQALRWHGLADADFREDAGDGRHYLLELNPRVPASIGLQAIAGLDVVNAWADVCLGRDAESASSREYRTGVSYRWTAPDLALAIRRPWTLPRWVAESVRSPQGDWGVLSAAGRWAALRNALWLARHRTTA